MNLFDNYVYSIPDNCDTIIINNGNHFEKIYINKHNDYIIATDYTGEKTMKVTPKMFDPNKYIFNCISSFKDGKYVYGKNIAETFVYDEIDKSSEYSYNILIKEIKGIDYKIEFEYYKDGSLFSMFVKNDNDKDLYITYMYS